MSLWVSASAQTLREYLAQHPAPSGPMIVLEPEGVKSEKPASTLADFHRVSMRAGSLSVIAPAEMVLVDDSFTQPPDFSDGLDRNAKIIYLLTLLNDREWASVTSEGLSAANLSGEARDVMESLLPKPFAWTAWGRGRQVDSGTVPGNQLDRIRLKLVRGLRFTVNAAGQPNAITTRFSADQPGVDGEVVYKLAEDEAARAPFGLKPLRVVANKPKQSQLDYAAPGLDASIDLPKSAKISEILSRIKAKTGVDLYCDFRVADRILNFEGTECRAGDLLQGIALTVTGTYRRIGLSYELTSDLSGIGARKLEFAIWEATARREMERRMSVWRAAIGQSGHLAQIRFPANSRFAPNAEMQVYLDKVDVSGSGEAMPGSDMPDQVRSFLKGPNAEGQTTDTATTRVQTQFEFEFVLPNGQELRPEPGLMTPSAYVAGAAQNLHTVSAVPSGPFSMTALNTSHSTRAAIAQVGDAAEARWLVDLFHRYGFKELWLEATRPEVVEAAAERCQAYQIALRLQVRPWALPGDYRSDDEDATILGDRGDRLAERQRQLDVWNAFCLEVPQPPASPYRSVSPEASSTFSRWAILSQLARIPGVSGVVLEDLQPYGYEGKRVSYMHSTLEKPMAEMSDFGYSIRQRLEFLQADSLDPIDTVGDDLNLKFDLRQPFFPDNAGGPGPVADPPDSRLAQLVAAWDKMRAASLSKAETALIDCLPKDLPLGILVSPARAAINDRGAPTVQFEDYFAAGPARPDARTFGRSYRFKTDIKEDPTTPLGDSLYDALTAQSSLCLDFREISLSDMAKVLDKNFMQVVPIKISQIDHPGKQ